MKNRAIRLCAVAAATCTSGVALALGGSAAAPAAVTHAPRVVAGPASSDAGWSASNWSGYAVAGGPYTSVSGRWVVPSVSRTHRQSYASTWVGIDGFGNSSLIQAGTAEDWYGGSDHYHAWWEILPASETAIDMAVSPGDVVSVAITQVSAGTFTISLADLTRNESFSTTQAYSGPLSSAEWIVEAPTVANHVATLAHYASPLTFDSATVNGGAAGLAAGDAGVMVQHGQQVSTPSDPDSDGDGFAMAYGATAPPPPPS
jgi:hypothetical protein